MVEVLSRTKQNWFQPVLNRPLPTHSPPAGYHAATRAYFVAMLIAVPITAAWDFLFVPPFGYLLVE